MVCKTTDSSGLGFYSPLLAGRLPLKSEIDAEKVTKCDNIWICHNVFGEQLCFKRISLVTGGTQLSPLRIINESL